MMVLGGGAVSYERRTPVMMLSGQVVLELLPQMLQPTRKVDVRLPGNRDSYSHGARLVHPIITMIKWIRTSSL